MPQRVIQANWFTEGGSNRPIGIIISKNAQGEKVAHIGTGYGNYEHIDAAHIVDWGAKLPVEVLEHIVATMKNANSG